MTDNEYASKIYCRVFRVADDNGDAYTRGTLDAIATLDERERTALECFFRKGMTYEQTGVFLGGVGKESARSMINKATLKLRHPSRARRISVGKLVGYLEKQLDDSGLAIAELQNKVERLSFGEPIRKIPRADAAPRKKGLGEIGFSPRTLNHLLNERLNTIDALLALESLDILIVRRGFGLKSFDEIIIKMRDHGYGEWADKMEKGRSSLP